MASKNYESEIQSKGVDKAITVDDIATDVFTTGSSVTFKSVWNAIRACIRAIIRRFDDVDTDIQGAQGTLELNDPPSISGNWSCTQNLTITGLTRKYTRGFFAFYRKGSESNVFGIPSLWTENMPNVQFYDQTLAYANATYFHNTAYFIGDPNHSSQPCVCLQSFRVQSSGNSNDITVTFECDGYNTSSSSYGIGDYELRYALF